MDCSTPSIVSNQILSSGTSRTCKWPFSLDTPPVAYKIYLDSLNIVSFFCIQRILLITSILCNTNISFYPLKKKKKKRKTEETWNLFVVNAYPSFSIAMWYPWLCIGCEKNLNWCHIAAFRWSHRLVFILFDFMGLWVYFGYYTNYQILDTYLGSMTHLHYFLVW